MICSAIVFIGDRLPVQTTEWIEPIIGHQFQSSLQLVDVGLGIAAHQFSTAGMTIQTEDEVLLGAFVQQLGVEVVTVTVDAFPFVHTGQSMDQRVELLHLPLVTTVQCCGWLEEDRIKSTDFLPY